MVNFSRSLEQFFLSVGQNNFGNKIPFLIKNWINGHGWALQTPNAGRTLVASQTIKPQEKILTDTALVSSPVIFSGQDSTQPNFFCISCFKICQGKKKCQKCKLPICDKPCSKTKIHVEDCPVLKGGILLIKLTDSPDSDFASWLKFH